MIDRVKSAEGDYEVVGRGDTPSEQFKNEYWRRVERTLKEVFDTNPVVAKQLRDRVDDAPSGTQTAFYHADPFEVAADLAGRRGEQITPEEKQRYVGTKIIAEPPTDEDLSSSRPEDKP